MRYINENLDNSDLLFKGKEKYITIAVAIICVLGIGYYIYYSSQPIVIKNPKKVVGLLYRKSPATKGYDANFIYYVYGIKYELSKVDRMYFVIGQKYNILYDSINPSNAKLLLKEPVFTIDDKTQTTHAKITSLETEFFSKKAENVNFEYQVDGATYQTCQFSDWDKYDVKLGDMFDLEYLESNPEIAIIHLDKKNNAITLPK